MPRRLSGFFLSFLVSGFEFGVSRSLITSILTNTRLISEIVINYKGGQSHSKQMK